MQREEPDGIVIVCDFCRRDWDGQEPMIEGHHGSILCVPCLQRALDEQSAGGEKFKCTLCLRFNMPPEMPRWQSPSAPEAIVCQECMYQAARAFHRNKDVAFEWDPGKYPPAVKPRVAAREESPEAAAEPSAAEQSATEQSATEPGAASETHH